MGLYDGVLKGKKPNPPKDSIDVIINEGLKYYSSWFALKYTAGLSVSSP
jgi:hypothetical protein